MTKLLTGRTLLQKAGYFISKSEMFQIKFTAILVLCCAHFCIVNCCCDSEHTILKCYTHAQTGAHIAI